MANVALGVTSNGSMGQVAIESIASNVFTTLGDHGFIVGDYVSLGGATKFIDAARSILTGYKTDGKPIYTNTATSGWIIADGFTTQTFKLSGSYGGSSLTYNDRTQARLWATPSVYVRDTNNPATATLFTTLSATVAAGATTISVHDASKLPDAPFVMIIEGPRESTPDQRYERVLVTAKNVNDLTVTRGYEGTADTEHTIDGTAGTTARRVYARSLAPTANAFANLDWRERILRESLSSGALTPSTATTNNDSTSTSMGFLYRDNSLYAVTCTGTTMTVTGSHGMSVGDRFVFMKKAGGTNVRMGHTYYVTGAVGGLQFAAEKHDGTYTADISAEISAGSYIRVLTRSGVPLFRHETSLYPRVVGWMYYWHTGHEFSAPCFDSNPITASLHLDPMTLRGSVSLLHSISAADGWESSDNKHMGQLISFHKNISSGSFTLTVNGVTTPAIVFSTNAWTMRNRIKNALVAILGSSANVRVFNRHSYTDGVLQRYGYYVTYGNSRFGIRRMDKTNLIGVDDIESRASLDGPAAVIKFSQIASYHDRLQRLGEEIASMANDYYGKKPIVIYRHNYEFETRHMMWTAFPVDGGTDAQQLSSDAGNTIANFKSQWNAMVTAIRTDGVASNAKFLWNPWGGKTVSLNRQAYPSTAPDFIGFDFYTQNGETAAAARTRLDQHLYGLRQVVPQARIIIGEFGHHVSGAIIDTSSQAPVYDPDSGMYASSGGDYASDGESDETSQLLASVSTTATVDNRDGWFNAVMIKLYAQTDVWAALYYDLDMGSRTNKPKATSKWTLDGTPSLVSAYAAKVIDKRNRRRVHF